MLHAMCAAGHVQEGTDAVNGHPVRHTDTSFFGRENKAASGKKQRKTATKIETPAIKRPQRLLCLFDALAFHLAPGWQYGRIGRVCHPALLAVERSANVKVVVVPTSKEKRRWEGGHLVSMPTC